MSSRFVCLVDACTRRRSRRFGWFGWTRGYREGGKSFQGTWSCKLGADRWSLGIAFHDRYSHQGRGSSSQEGTLHTRTISASRNTNRARHLIQHIHFDMMSGRVYWNGQNMSRSRCTHVLYLPQTLRGASSSIRIGWARKISRDL